MKKGETDWYSRLWWGKNVLSVSRTFRKCRKIAYLEEIKTSTNLSTFYFILDMKWVKMIKWSKSSKFKWSMAKSWCLWDKWQIGSVICNRKGYGIASKMVSQESSDVLELPQPNYRHTRDKLAQLIFLFFLVSFIFSVYTKWLVGI